MVYQEWTHSKNRPSQTHGTGWLQIDLGKESRIAKVIIDEAGYGRIQRFEVQVNRDDSWITLAKGKSCGDHKILKIDKPVEGREFRLHILEANEVPTISEFQLFDR